MIQKELVNYDSRNEIRGSWFLLNSEERRGAQQSSRGGAQMQGRAFGRDPGCTLCRSQAQGGQAFVQPVAEGPARPMMMPAFLPSGRPPPCPLPAGIFYGATSPVKSSLSPQEHLSAPRSLLHSSPWTRPPSWEQRHYLGANAFS